MQNAHPDEASARRSSSPPFRLAVCVLLVCACVKEISSEERLERETQIPQRGKPIGAEELAKVNCNDTQAELAKARNEQKPEIDRLHSYMELYESLKKRTQTFEEAMNRNPDLAYTEGSAELVAAREKCIEQTADVKVEFERYVRELVEVPTVKEITNGREVVVARLDFESLREAIEALAPDDKDALLSRVASAEKKVTVKPESRKRGGGK